MFGNVIGCDTNQKAPFITKRGRFELMWKDSHKRRLSFAIFDQQAFFGSKLEAFDLQKIDFQEFQSFQQMKRRLFKRKRSTLTINKRRLFNEQKKVRDLLKIKLYEIPKIWSVIQKIWMISGLQILNNYANFWDCVILSFRIFSVEN